MGFSVRRAKNVWFMGTVHKPDITVCVNSYFLEKVEDEEVHPIIEWTIDTSKENISIMRELFKHLI
ncbi:hypothetical protein [Lederbergia citrea]|uniref:Uncharacterized protein n=3 Tax=Lederbergia citrea TaxID=2833581 RepID=A0A942UPQ7_9BACI|nr:hypothetical protein [Lederbergia citrea]MBS4221794.1 hypothetical protein [Lederbergia citrea]